MKKTKFITMASLIAAMYVVLTYITSVFGLANGAIQCRLSESLLVLPMFTPCAVPGLFAGCLLSNLLTGAVLYDVLFGSLATLVGAFGAYLLRNRHPAVATLPNVVSNAVIIPFVLKYAYDFDEGIMYFLATVGIGEIISCSLLGLAVYKVLNKHKSVLFKK